MTLVKDYCNKYRDHRDGFLQWGKESRLNSECNIGEWQFIDEEQGGGPVHRKWLKGNINGKGEFWLN